MTTEQTRQLEQIIQKSLEEHRAITQLIQQLLEAIDNKPVGDRTAWQANLQKQAGELYGHLKEHFALEEDGGFMTPVLEVRPTKAPIVETLKAEHRLLLEELDKLAQTMCKTAPSDCDACEKLCESFKQLVKSLKKHEQTEDRLLQSAFAEDIGTKD
jgi:hemerythrin-like domain-containing protein